LEYLRNECFATGELVLEVDLRSFSTLSIIGRCGADSRRVQDGVISRLIAKWLKAGVMGKWKRELSRRRNTPGRGDLTTDQQYISP
jgi:hypothetical protein